MAIDNETLHDFLQKVLEVERKYSYEKSGTETSKVDELMQLVEVFSVEGVCNED